MRSQAKGTALRNHRALQLITTYAMTPSPQLSLHNSRASDPLAQYFVLLLVSYLDKRNILQLRIIR